ncbi:VanW family protein, partial [Patescibacteria group bacterium]|nr:VanW family protein [Patescibacteria group bacterium]
MFNTDSGEENTKIKIKFDKEVKHFTAQSLGIELQKKSAAQGTFSSILSAFPQKNGFILTYDQSESEKIIREQFNLEFPRSASFHLENGELVIVPEQDAPFFDVETLMKEIADSYPEKTNFKIKEIDFTPATEEEVEPFSDLAKLLLTEGLKANFEGRDFTFPMQEKDLVFTKTGPSLSAPFATYVLKTLQDQVSHQEENLIILEADLSTLSLAKTEGHVRDGFLVDPPQTLQSIQTALTSHQNTFTIEGTILKGRVINETQLDLGEMTLIGAGRSNFARSPGGRDYNIRRALNEYYNGALIPTDGEFSYNALLGPITYSAGWKGSLAIFLGTDLEEVPGGGLCQVSTTIYRAA